MDDAQLVSAIFIDRRPARSRESEAGTCLAGFPLRRAQGGGQDLRDRGRAPLAAPASPGWMTRSLSPRFFG